MFGRKLNEDINKNKCNARRHMHTFENHIFHYIFLEYTKYMSNEKKSFSVFGVMLKERSDL